METHKRRANSDKWCHVENNKKNADPVDVVVKGYEGIL